MSAPNRGWFRPNAFCRRSSCRGGVVGAGRRYPVELLEARVLLAVDPLRTIADDQFNTGTEGPNAAVVGTRLVLADPTVKVTAGDSESPTGLVRLYDLNTGGLLRTLADPEPNKFGEFGKSVAKLGADRVIVGDPGQRSTIFGDPGLAKVFVFDANSGSVVQTIADPTVELPKQIFSRFGSSVAGLGTDRVLVGEPAAADGGKVYLFDVASGALLRTFNNPNPGVTRFGDGLTPLGGNLFASAGARVTLFNADTGALAGAFAVPGLGASAVPSIAAAGADRVVVGNSGAGYLIDTAGALVRTFNSPDPALTGPNFATEVAALDDGTLLLSAPSRDNSAISDDARDGAIYLVDPDTGGFIDVLINPAADFGTFPAILETAPGGLAITGALTTSFSPFAKNADFYVFDADPLVLASVGGATLLDGGTVDFGTVVRGQTGPVRDVVLTNPSGSAPLNLNLALPGGYTRVGGGSNVSVPAGGSTTLSIRLSDTAQTRKLSVPVTLTSGSDAFTFSVTGNVALALIPDGGTVTHARTVAGSTGGVSDVNVTLNITHPEDDDLQVFLISPSGTRVQLFANVGTFVDINGDTVVGQNFVGTKLDDDARRQSNSGPFTEDVPVIGTNDVNDPGDLPPFTGVFKPQGGTLSTFDNELADGSWTLEITDTQGNAKAGSLDSWELQLRSKGLRFLDENGVLLDEFDSIAFSTDDAPIELSGDPGPAKRFFIRNDGDVALAVGDLDVPFDETGTLRFSLLEAPSPGLVLQPGESTSFLIQQLFTEEGSFGDNLTMGGSAERFVVTGAVRRPVGRPEIAVFRDVDGQPVVDNQPTFLDFGTVAQGSAPPSQVLMIKNFGARDVVSPPDPSILNVINMSLPAGFVAEAVDGGAVNRALAGDDSGFYAIRIRMLTAQLGSREGPIVIDNNDTDETAFNFPVKGAVTDGAVPAEVDVADTSGTPDDRAVVLDTTQIGTSSGLQTFTLRNLGGEALNVSNFAKGGVNAGEFDVTLKNGSGSVVNGSTFTVDAGDTYTIDVRFTPAGAGGRSGNLTFNTNDPDDGEGTVTLALVGNGSTTPVENAEVDVRLDGAGVADGQPAEINFGTTSISQGAITRTFQVRNVGSVTLNLGTPVLPTGFSISEPLAGALAPGAQDEFTIRLDDTLAGTRFGSVRISTNDPDESTFDFPVRGVVNPALAGSPPEIRVADGGASLTSGEAVDLGSVAQGGGDLVRTFTVFNEGGSELTLAAPVLPAGFVLLEPLNASIAPGGSDSFQVSLSGATPGSFAGNLSIATNDADEGTYVLALSGSVTAVPGVSVSEVVPSKLPGQPIIGGDKKAKGTVEVRLANSASDAVSGSVTYTLFLSTDPVLGGAPDTQIGALGKALKLKAGATPKPLKVKVTIPGLETGDYFIIAQASGAGIKGSSVKASGATVRVEKPVVRFPTVGAGGELALVFGKAATLPVTLNNQGNVDAKGTATLRLSVSPVDQPGSVVFTQDLPGQKLSVKRGASKAQKVKVTFAAGQFPPGRYVLTVRLTGEGGLASIIEGGDTPVALLTFAIA